MTKTTMLLAAALLASASFGQAKDGKQSLASARAKITQVIENPDEMTEVMKTLSAEDQRAFLAEVNSAIDSMPGDDAERNAKFVAVENAALAGALKGNALALVAEVFATVPPTALTAVNESLGEGLMNRAADKGVTYTDEQYIAIVQKVMEKVNERVAGVDNSGVRSGFAGLMLIRGSNVSTNDAIYDAVVAAMPESSRNDAKVEWFPAALGRGREKTYEPMLAVVDVAPGKPTDVELAERPDADDVDTRRMISLRIPASENMIGLLTDITGANSDSEFAIDSRNPVVDAIQNPLEFQLPNLGAGPADDPASIVTKVEDTTTIKEEPQTGYQGQTRW